MEKCEICEKEVKTKQQLKMHMTSHKNTSESNSAKSNKKTDTNNDVDMWE